MAQTAEFAEPGRMLRAVLLILYRAPAPMYADQLKKPRNPEGVSHPAKYLSFAKRNGLATAELSPGGEKYALTEQGRSVAAGLAANLPPTGPMPTAVKVVRTDCAPDNRNVYCSSYGSCVNTAIRQGWVGFSCLECPLYSKDNRPPAEHFMVRDGTTQV